MEVMATQPRSPPMRRFLHIDGAFDFPNLWVRLLSRIRDVTRPNFCFGGLQGEA